MLILSLIIATKQQVKVVIIVGKVTRLSTEADNCNLSETGDHKAVPTVPSQRTGGPEKLARVNNLRPENYKLGCLKTSYEAETLKWMIYFKQQENSQEHLGNEIQHTSYWSRDYHSIPHSIKRGPEEN